MMESERVDTTEAKEIDFRELAKKLWLEKKIIFKVLIVAFIIGIIVAFSIPKEYTSIVVLSPDTDASNTGTIGTLAALTGMNLGVGGDAMASPDIYPNIFQSTPFLIGLFDINVKDREKGIDTSLYIYMKEHQSAAWWNIAISAPSALIGLFSKSEDSTGSTTVNSRYISKEDMDIITNLQERLLVTSDTKTGITTISVKMQSPEISAYLADTLTSYLQSYIVNYRTQKARQDLSYTEKLYDESKENYYNSQKKLATFIDGNMNVVSAKYKTTQDRLQNETSLAYSVYNQMAQQLQMAKIKVQDTTPVFTIIQPSVQPLLPSKPSRRMILMAFLFLALVGTSLWILRTDIFGK